MATYTLENGQAKVQVEDLLGTAPTGGWVYQAPGTGNAGAQGAHYYYRSETDEGSHKTAPVAGRFSFDLDVGESGLYSLLMRASRDTNTPGDARNDIWIRVDSDTQGAMPDGTGVLTSGGDGFVKFKGGLSAKWSDLKLFSTPVHGDSNPASTVILDAGLHTISFAPRSTGLHIDSLRILRVGDAPGGTTTGTIALASDDFESNKGAVSDDLDFGRDSSSRQSVGLRFSGMELAAGDRIESAYFVFEASASGGDAAAFTIAIEDTTAAATYSKLSKPDMRAYHDLDVDWTPEAWTAGASVRSADVSALIAAVIADGGLDALDALAFRVSGTGVRAAVSSEADPDAAPVLVINWA